MAQRRGPLIAVGGRRRSFPVQFQSMLAAQKASPRGRRRPSRAAPIFPCLGAQKRTEWATGNGRSRTSTSPSPILFPLPAEGVLHLPVLGLPDSSPPHDRNSFLSPPSFQHQFRSWLFPTFPTLITLADRKRLFSFTLLLFSHLRHFKGMRFLAAAKTSAESVALRANH